MSLECAGHGQRQYTNFIYPFKCDPPRVADGVNYVGCYEARFAAPPAWAGRRVYLYFEGVAVRVPLLGERRVRRLLAGRAHCRACCEPRRNCDGYHGPRLGPAWLTARGARSGQDSFLPAEFDVTAALRGRRRAQRAVAARPALLRRELHGGAGAAAGVAVGGWA